MADGRVLDWMEAFLKQDILEALALWGPERGAPQRAGISLVFSNLYLDSIDVAVAGVGFRMVRYAGDSVILWRSHGEVGAALALMQPLTAEKGLRMHPEKTRLVDAMGRGVGFDFLGCHFERGARWSRRRSMNTLRDTLHRKTRGRNGTSPATTVDDVNSTQRVGSSTSITVTEGPFHP